VESGSQVLALSALMWLSQYDGSLSTYVILEIISRTCFPPGGGEMLSCQELVDCCRGLVVVVDSYDLRFVHLTLLHYLRDCPIFPREQVHILLTKASLTYFAPSELGTFAEAHILCWLKQVGVMSEHLEAVERSTVIEFEQFLDGGTCTPHSLLPDSLNCFYVWVGFGSPKFYTRVPYSKLQLATLLGRCDYVSRKLLQGSRDAVDNGSPTLLALAAAMPGQLEMMHLLLDRGASPNAVAWKESRPLHWAAAADNYPAAELLLEKGALVDAVGTYNNTALHVATFNNNMGLVKLLVAHHADVRAQGKEGWTPLHMACLRGLLTLVEFFVTQQAPSTWVALRDSSGFTPLHTAAREGRVQVVACLLNMSMGLMQDKTSRTSLLEARDCQGRTALIAAVDECRRTDVHDLIEVVMVLLRHGADPSASDCAGWTALHGLCALSSHPRSAGTVMLALLAHGADASSKNNHGLTPLHLLVRRLPSQTHLMTLLVQHIASGGLVSSPDGEGCTPLHHAVMSAEGLSLLLVLGASPNERDLLGWTALHWMAFSNDTDVDVDDVESRIDVLLNARGQLDAIDASGRTPLDVAFDEWSHMLLYDPQHSHSASTIFWAFHRRGAGFSKKQKDRTFSISPSRDDSAIRGSVDHVISGSCHLRRSRSCDTMSTASRKSQLDASVEAGELLRLRRREKAGRLQQLDEQRALNEELGPDFEEIDPVPRVVFGKPLRCSVWC
jgi:ankyrin repeat protein